MNKIRNSKAGFTLIELLIVVIIVAVLAAVGIPLLTGNLQRARLSEADAGLGTIRTAVRAAGVENPTFVPNALAFDGTMGFTANDLTGRYFEDDDYDVTGTAMTDYCISVTGDAAGNAPKGGDVAGLTRSMNEDGDIFNTADCTGTAVN